MTRGRCEMYSLTGFCLRGERCPFDHVRSASTGLMGILDRAGQLLIEQASSKLFRTRHDAMRANIERVDAEMQRQYAATNALDLVFVMDCTGSMQPWIDAAKTSILGIIDSVKTTHRHATVRVGFVAYRDFCDGILRIESHALTEDIASVRAFVARLRAFGGGDIPEDIPGGLDEALKMCFTAAAKRVILVTDAPCHGLDFHNMCDYPSSVEKAAAGPDIRAQMRTLARRGIDFTFIEIEPIATAKMAAILQQEYQKVVAADGLEREFCKVSLSQNGDAVRFGPVVASAASSSLSASKMRSVVASADKVLGVSSYAHYGPSGQKSTTLVGISEAACEDDDFVEIAPMSPLDWSALDDAVTIPAVRHSYHFRQGQEINWASIQLKHSTQATTIKLLPTCFARGAMRSAHAMYDATMGKRFVAKVYYGRAALDVARGVASTGWSLEDDVKTQVVAKRLAVEFSLVPAVPDGVDFIFTSWYEIQDPTAYGLSATMAAFTAEPYIAGEYKKYNNNNGWICESGSAAQLRDTAQAFSHFTWQRTYGQLMVVDLQGVGCIFTDPQIHSVDKHAFGRGNRAEAGMAVFFCTHECNQVCAALGLIECTGSGSSRGGGSSGRSGGRRERRVEDSVCIDTTAHHEDKTMTCSCGLCGEILGVARSAFVRAYAKGREVHCDACAAKVAVREARVCGVCEETMEVATFWYEMKGMAVPTSCKKCKAVAARMAR